MATHPLRILIVEDQFLIAKQVEMLLVSGGYAVVGMATTMDEALDQAAESRPDVALVDLSLADGLTGTAIARHLIEESGIDVVFTTANMRRLPQDYCGAIGVLEKPFTKAGLLAAMAYVAARLDGDDAPSVPSSLRLAPSGAPSPHAPAGNMQRFASRT